MAITFDAVSQGSATGTSLTYSHTVGTGSNRLLVVGITLYLPRTSDITGVTYAGTAMTLIDSAENVDGGQTSLLYYLLNPATGANNVVITKTASTTIYSAATSYFGVKQSSQPDAYGHNSAGTTSTGVKSISKAVTTVADKCWMVSYAFNDASFDTAGGTGTTRRTTANIQAIGDSNADITPEGSYSMAWTNTINARWTMVSASFSPSIPTSSGFFALLGGL